MPGDRVELMLARGRNWTDKSVHWGPWRVVLLVISALVVLVSIFQVVGRVEHHDGWPVRVSLVCLIWLIVYFWCSYGQFKTVYLFTTAYVVPLCLFHLGITIPQAFGWIDVPGWSSGALSPWLERAGWYMALSLGCIGFGFGLSLKRANFRVSRFVTESVVANRNRAVAYWDGIGLLVASAVFLGMVIYSVGNLLNFSRNDFFKGVGDTRGLGAFIYVFPSAILLLVIGARKSSEKTFSIALASLAFFVVLLSGYRTTALFPLLVGAVLWVKVGRRITNTFAMLAIAFVLIAIPIVGALRAMGPYEKIDKQDIEASAEHASIEKTFLELGQTAGVAAHVFRLVPEIDPYRFGMTYLQELRQSIPNIGFSQSVSERVRGKRDAYTDPEAISNLPPSDWLTFRIAPDKFDSGQGVGFSALGEPYLNFGTFGVVVFFIALGFLLGRLDSSNLLSTPNLLVFAVAFLWPLMRTVRDDFGNFIKPAIFVLIVIVIWRMMTKLLMPGKGR